LATVADAAAAAAASTAAATAAPALVGPNCWASSPIMELSDAPLAAWGEAAPAVKWQLVGGTGEQQWWGAGRDILLAACSIEPLASAPWPLFIHRKDPFTPPL